MSKIKRLVPARVFLKWWERLNQLDRQETEQGDAANVGEAGQLLTVLLDIGHANGAVRDRIESAGYGAESTASFSSVPDLNFDWENGEITLAPEHPYSDDDVDPEPLIAAIVRVTGIPEGD